MCGFAGLIHIQSTEKGELAARVGVMADALDHRGPDDSGLWLDPAGHVALGFRRLSILDLSPAGHQPMVSPSGRLAMVFNGEVYNFSELRDALTDEGTSFRGKSDSEVVLAAIDRWGLEPALQRLIGMFAIALWDIEARELTLIRDRLGIKPLYLARTKAGFAFASELGALMRAPGFDTALDPSAIQTYLRYLYIPAPRTPFGSVSKVPPGHLIRIPHRALRTDEDAFPAIPYWSLGDARVAGSTAPLSDRSSSDASLTEALDALLNDAVRLRMVADVPLGALLSAGIDSTLVVALMQVHSSQPVRTYTIGFDQREHDESERARRIARHIGTDHTELRLGGKDALDVVPMLAEIFDEPLADPSQIPTYLVSRLARQNVTVALSGDGGDELFAGYNRYAYGSKLIGKASRMPVRPRRMLGSVLRQIPTSAVDQLYSLGGLRTGGNRLVGQKANKLGRLLGSPSPSTMYRTLLSSLDNPQDLMMGAAAEWDPILEALPEGNMGLSLDDMQLVDQRYYLPDDLLQKVDRASMALSLEVRVPLLDHRVVEFSWMLPERCKIRHGRTKWLLRQVLQRYVPSRLVEGPKVGFTVPIASWLRGALRPWAEDMLLERSRLRDNLFNRTAVESVWRRFLGGHSEHALGLWAIATLEAWRRHWRVEDIREAA